jgi:biotin carboxyl carrier protein
LKRLVDGVEVEFPELDLTISRLPDRLLVHTPDGSFSALAVRHGGAVLVSYRGRQYRLERPGTRKSQASSEASGELRASIPGTVTSVRVQQGDEIAKGETVLVIEAMKTQQPFTAPFDAVVERLAVRPGEAISEGALLAILRLQADNP